MKKNVKKHTNGVWYYAVVRWDGYGVFTSWDRARVNWDCVQVTCCIYARLTD